MDSGPVLDHNEAGPLAPGSSAGDLRPVQRWTPARPVQSGMVCGLSAVSVFKMCPGNGEL